jgi:AcrR family transcriptional regulator
MRADAQRNYDKLLEEARQAFIVHGTEVALEDIARHAGVGIGTLYRHFPDRYSLMNAVFEQELEKITEQARDLLTADDPTEALVKWLKAVAVHSSYYRGLSAAIMTAPDSKMPACKQLLRSAGADLLSRAQEAGEIRLDTSIGDLLKLTSVLVTAAESDREDRALFGRLMSLVMDGLRTRPQDAPDPVTDASLATAAGATS